MFVRVTENQTKGLTFDLEQFILIRPLHQMLKFPELCLTVKAVLNDKLGKLENGFWVKKVQG